MPGSYRPCAWMAVRAIAVGIVMSTAPAGAQTGPQTGPQTGAARPAADVLPVLESRCRPRLTCWLDHWGYRRCFRRWVCSGDPLPDFRSRAPGRRRYSLEEDYAPESGFRRDREPPWRRYRGREGRLVPEVVRPFRRAEPTVPDRRRVTVRPRLKEVPDREPSADPDAEARKPAVPETNRDTEPNQETEIKKPADREAEAEAALRRQEQPAPRTQPDTGPEVEIIPRPQPAPAEKETARLKVPPVAPPKPDTEAPAPVKLTPLPTPPRKRPPDKLPAPPEKKPDARKSDKRKSDTVPDDIDKLPRGRKIPMDEIDPPKPKKKLPERMPI